MIRTWKIDDTTTRKHCIDSIIARLDVEESNEIGVIAAQDIIDIVAQHIGPLSYNNGIADSKKLITTKIADLEIELDILKVSI